MKTKQHHMAIALRVALTTAAIGGIVHAQTFDATNGITLGTLGKITNAPVITTPTSVTSGVGFSWEFTPALQGLMVPAGQFTGLKTDNTAVSFEDLIPIKSSKITVVTGGTLGSNVYNNGTIIDGNGIETNGFSLLDTVTNTPADITVDNGVLSVNGTPVGTGSSPTSVALVSPTSPAGTTVGEIVYNTNPNSGLPVGLVYWNGTKWVGVTNNETIISQGVDPSFLGYIPSSVNTAQSIGAANPFYTVPTSSVITALKGTTTYGGHSYALYSTSGTDYVTWYEAYAAAKSFGGYLATFTTRDEWVAVNNLLDANGAFDTHGAWIGMARIGFGGGGWVPDQIRWITGETPANFYEVNSVSNTRVQAFHNFVFTSPDNSGGNEGFIHVANKTAVGLTTAWGAGTTHGWNDVPANAASAGSGGGFIVEFQQ